MIRIEKNVPLSPLTTFKIGGLARYLVNVETEEEIRDAIAWAKKKSIKFTILAGGSNTLMPDEGLNVLIIRIKGGKFSFNETVLLTEAGCDLLDLIRKASNRNLGGWESLAGIPGTIGGAVRGNAGAFGSEIKDFVVSVRALDSNNGEVREFPAASCNFSYRHSYFKEHPEWIILNTVLKLMLKRSGESMIKIEETIKEREKRHLQNIRAAGSFFMNPILSSEVIAIFEDEKKIKSREGRVPAGWLIEKAGMKGYRVGGAIASEQHPNYLVNMHNASAKDVLKLADMIKNRVKEQFGIELVEEAAIFS